LIYTQSVLRSIVESFEMRRSRCRLENIEPPDTVYVGEGVFLLAMQCVRGADQYSERVVYRLSKETIEVILDSRLDDFEVQFKRRTSR